MGNPGTECEIGRLLTYRVAWMQEKGMPFDAEAAIVKLYTVELNQRVAATAMEVLGLYSGLPWAAAYRGITFAP